MSYKDNLKSKLEQLMKQHNVTNEILAEQTGISRSSINRIRMNKGNPTVETLLPICNFFNVSLQEITSIDPIQEERCFSAELIPLNGANNLAGISLVSWESLGSSFLEQDSLQENTLTHIKRNNAKLYGVLVPQEYINVPKESVLIFDRNRYPAHGNYILVKERKSGVVNIVEYIRDITIEYIRSCLPRATNHHDVQLLPLNDFIILGVILEARKIFIPIQTKETSSYGCL